MRKARERQALAGPLAGWVALVASVSLTALLFTRLLDLEVIGISVAEGSDAGGVLAGRWGAALASVLVLAVCGATLLFSTLVSALLRNHRLTPRYAAMLYGRPIVVVLHLLYPAGALYGLLLLAVGGERIGALGLGLLAAWAAVGASALLPFVGWLARDPEPEIIDEIVTSVGSSVARCFRKSDFSSAAKGRILQRLRELGGIGQRFVLGGDPQRAADVLEAFHDIVMAYLDRKDPSQQSWFIADAASFPDLSPKMLDTITTSGTWFELACLQQMRAMLRTGQAAASDLPGDAATLLGRMAIEALGRHDHETLRLVLSYLYDLLSDELVEPRRAGTLAELLAALRRVTEEGLQLFPGLVETLGRTLSSLALLALQSGRPPQAQRLLGELVELITRSAAHEVGPQLWALYLRAGPVFRAQSVEASRLWDRGLLVLAVMLRHEVTDAHPLARNALAEVRKLELGLLADTVVLESAPLGWENVGFGLDRTLREGIVKLARELRAGPPS